MGIYIKGMKMPKDDCEAYRQIIITNNFVDGKIQMLAHDASTNEFIGEVVELPPHGRLIDLDALFDNAQKRMQDEGMDEDELTARMKVLEWCFTNETARLYAPIVIPSEEDK